VTELISLARKAGNIFYPYRDFNEAKQYLCRYADQVYSPFCGVTFGHSGQICLIRPPSGLWTTWMHVTRHPYPPAPPAPPREPNWADRGWEVYKTWYEAEAETFPAAQRAYTKWAIENPKTAGALSVASDIFGLVLVIGFVASGAGAVALSTAALAGLANVFLLATDGTNLYSDITGNEDARNWINSIEGIETARTFATVALLIDFPISSWRSLVHLRGLQATAKAAEVANKQANAASRAFARAARRTGSSDVFKHRWRQATAAKAQALRSNFKAAIMREQFRLKFTNDAILAPVGTVYTESSLWLKDPAQFKQEQEQAIRERIAAGGALERPDYALQVFFSADEIDY